VRTLRQVEIRAGIEHASRGYKPERIEKGERRGNLKETTDSETRRGQDLWGLWGDAVVGSDAANKALTRQWKQLHLTNHRNNTQGTRHALTRKTLR